MMTTGTPLPLLSVITSNPYMAHLTSLVLLSLYGKYLVMDLDCDGTQQAMKVVHMLLRCLQQLKSSCFKNSN